ncbi:hypothetical protein BJV82DRAFT_591863 [Fennellomyces sp. T-0311]|nr:hypothetical protein BJV82DRAFT_591863 [Fennellomyces sp. T-0311]
MAQYTESFLTVRPKDGFDIVQEHMKAGKTIDEEFAQYFKERALIEDQYAKSLVKASKKLFVMDKGTLGNFAPIWDLLFNEFTEVSTAHAMLSFKIAEEIEKPLRQVASSEHGKIKSMEPTFQRVSKEYDDNAKKSKDKGSLFKRTNKDNSRRGLESAAATWYKDGPAFLESHQRLEEARLQRLKSLVEKFEQIQTDQMLKRMEIANVTMSAATAYDASDDIQDFCKTRARNLQKVTPNEHQRRPSYEERQLSGSIHSSSAGSPAESPRAEQKKGRVKSAFSLRRKTRNGSALRLPDANSFGAIDEEPNDVPAPARTPASSTRESYLPPSESDRNTSVPPASVHSTEQQIPTSQSPAVDAEGYSVPPPDRSEYSAALNDNSSGFDADSASGQGSQRFKIDIHNNSIDTNDKHEADAALNRMSTLLRDKTPSISRRPRGRRENIRSMQIESGLYSNQGSQIFNVKDADGSAVSSTATTPTNPFHQNSFEASTPTSTSSVSHSPAMSHEIPNQLRPIRETAEPQVYASIVELTERDPQAGNDGPIRVQGQIKLVYNGPSSSNAPLLLRLGNISNIQLQVNPQYVERWNNETDVFALKVSAFDDRRRTPVPCFQYQLEVTDGLPIQLKPAWKCVDDSTYVIVKYEPNPSFDPEKSQMAVCIKFDQVPVTNVQSTPQGSWDTGKKQLTWPTEVFTQDSGSSRLLAKFVTTEKGAPVPTVLKYFLKDALMSKISIEAVPASGSTLQVKQVQKVVRSDKTAFV